MHQRSGPLFWMNRRPKQRKALEPGCGIRMRMRMNGKSSPGPGFPSHCFPTTFICAESDSFSFFAPARIVFPGRSAFQSKLRKWEQPLEELSRDLAASSLNFTEQALRCIHLTFQSKGISYIVLEKSEIPDTILEMTATILLGQLKRKVVRTRYRSYWLLVAPVLVILLIWMCSGGTKKEVSPEDTAADRSMRAQAKFLFSEIYYYVWAGERPKPQPAERKLGLMEKIMKYFVY